MAASKTEKLEFEPTPQDKIVTFVEGLTEDFPEAVKPGAIREKATFLIADVTEDGAVQTLQVILPGEKAKHEDWRVILELGYCPSDLYPKESEENEVDNRSLSIKVDKADAVAVKPLDGSDSHMLGSDGILKLLSELEALEPLLTPVLADQPAV